MSQKSPRLSELHQVFWSVAAGEKMGGNRYGLETEARSLATTHGV